MTPLALTFYALPLLKIDILSDPYNIPKIYAAALIALLAAFQNMRCPDTPLDPFMLILGLCLVVATIHSANPAISALGQYRIYTSGLLPLLLGGLLFYLASGSGDWKDEYDWLSFHFVTSACISSLWALVQLASPTEFSDGRPYAGLGSPVFLGAFLAIAAPLAAAQSRWLALCLILVAIIATETRAALVAATLGLAHLAHNRIIVPCWARIGSVILFLILGIVMTLRRDDCARADRGRVYVYRAAIKTILEHPFLGYGPDMFVDAFAKNRPSEWFKDYSPQSLQGSAHNDILNAAVSGGVILVAAYLAFCWAVWRALPEGAAGLASACLALFAFAKMNEVGIAIKLVFLTLLGSALKSQSSQKARLFIPTAATILVIGTYMLLDDRLVSTAIKLNSKTLMQKARFLNAIYNQ